MSDHINPNAVFEYLQGLQGRIVEAGGHEALLSIGGRYADLHARQTGLAPERKAA